MILLKIFVRPLSWCSSLPIICSLWVFILFQSSWFFSARKLLESTIYPFFLFIFNAWDSVYLSRSVYESCPCSCQCTSNFNCLLSITCCCWKMCFLYLDHQLQQLSISVPCVCSLNISPLYFVFLLAWLPFSFLPFNGPPQLGMGVLVM